MKKDSIIFYYYSDIAIMSKRKNTKYRANDLASDWHRVLGSACYFIDIDQMAFGNGSKEEMYIEYAGKKRVAIFDFKFPGEKIINTFSTDRQRELADDLGIPFFICITYLDPLLHPTKCFFLMPGNKIAKPRFEGKEGRWLSIRAMSRLQHALRNIKWDENEVIDGDNLEAVGLARGTRIRDLPNGVGNYNLPLLHYVIPAPLDSMEWLP